MQGRLSNAMHARTMRMMSYCMSLQRNIAATLVEAGSRAHQRVFGWTKEAHRQAAEMVNVAPRRPSRQKRLPVVQRQFNSWALESECCLHAQIIYRPNGRLRSGFKSDYNDGKAGGEQPWHQKISSEF